MKANNKVQNFKTAMNLALVFILFSITTSKIQANGIPFQKGDFVISTIGFDRVSHGGFHAPPFNVFIQITFPPCGPFDFSSNAMDFDNAGNLFMIPTTSYCGSKIAKFNNLCNNVAYPFNIDSNNLPSRSICTDDLGNIYVLIPHDSIRKYTSTGQLEFTYGINTNGASIAGMDIYTNQGILYYTLIGFGSKRIKRFNVITNSQMADFDSSHIAVDVRIRNNGEVFVTGVDTIFRYGSGGNLIQQYYEKCNWNCLDFDTTDAAFWIVKQTYDNSYEIDSSELKRINISDGAAVTLIDNLGSLTINGFRIYKGPYTPIPITPASCGLITNSDFSLGNVGFTTTYSICNSQNCMGEENTYAIGSNANFFLNIFQGTDHTTGTGNFMIVNGSVTSSHYFWKQSVTVSQNTQYNFSAWFSTVFNVSPAVIQIKINGVFLGNPFPLPGSVNNWSQLNVVWNSLLNTTADIEIYEISNAYVGNDFGMDDICFTPVILPPTILADKYHGGSGDGYSSSSNGIEIPFQVSVLDSVSPKQNEIAINKSQDIRLCFKNMMNGATINSSTVKVYGSQTGYKSSVISYDSVSKKATINPVTDFKTGEEVFVIVKKGILSLSGDSLKTFQYKYTVDVTKGDSTFTATSMSFVNPLSASGDVDNDGDLDIITYDPNVFPNKFKVYKNNGSGSFSQSSDFIIGIGYGFLFISLTLEDSDGDGDLDVFVTTEGIASTMYVVKNDGTGTFPLMGFSYSLYTEIPVERLFFADFDNDGDKDIIMNKFGLKILSNDGTGNFDQSYDISYAGSEPVATGDFNVKDGLMDILTSGDENGYTRVVIYKNNGDLSFTKFRVLDSIPQSTYSYDYGLSEDYNKDRNPDFLISQYPPKSTSKSKIYRVLGSGLFFTTPQNISDNVINGMADFDNDKDLDFILTNSSNQLSLFKNNGAGGNPAVFSNQLGMSGGKYFSGDFDNDGDIDILSGNKLYLNGNAPLIVSAVPALGNSVTTFGATNLTFSGNVSITAPLTVSYYSNIPVPGTLPPNVISVNNFYWSVNNDSGVIFANGIMSIPLSLLGGANPNTLTWLKRSNPGDNWTNIGGTVVDSNFVSTLPFSSFSEFVTGVINGSTFNIKAIIEGFYDVLGNKLSMRDTLSAYLRNTNSPYNSIDSSKAVIDSVTFTGSFIFANAPAGTYYIQLIHRNGIETWSKSGGELFTAGSNMNYDFTTSASQSYGNNLTQKGSKFCIFSGDINQDGIIDLNDLGIIDNEVQNYSTGYIPSDINGDGGVDISDMSIAENNSFNFVTVRNPIDGDAPESHTVRERKLNNKIKGSKLNKESNSLDIIPEKFELKNNYPNPFNPITNIKYDLPVSGFVSLKVFDITGREIASLVNENQNAGKYSIQWDASKFSSGTYFYKIVSGEFSQVKRMILVK